MNEFILQKQLQDYVNSGLYPFHMPGHKRRMSPAPGLPYAWDVTEVSGSDDLHHAEGILREAMERTAALFGAARTWYLVGGSTCGNLAAIRAAAPAGSEVIAARNCHKSVYHAIELGGLRVHWIEPPLDPVFGVYGSVPVREVERLLREHPGVRAVILTSPTYEGVLSDIRSIAALCHDREHPAALVVDEAHGAHLGLFTQETDGFFPVGAVACGADLVIQSAHKTLPSLTQTALLHLQGKLLSPEEVERQLEVFETSSPSYPLLASLDGCTGILRERGAELFRAWKEKLLHFDRQTALIPGWRVLCHGRDSVGNHPDFYAYDPGKILFRREWDGKVGQDGKNRQDAQESEEILRTRYRIELEMRCGENLLAMTSCCDDEAALDTLARALQEMGENTAFQEPELRDDDSQRNGECRSPEPQDDGSQSCDVCEAACSRGEDASCASRLPVQGMAWMTIAQALARPRRFLPEQQAEGKIAAEYVWAYPPGVPVLAPGEEVTADYLRYAAACRSAGTRLYHSARGAQGELCVVQSADAEKDCLGRETV
ncbi:MAG: aminotransferase class V-fold PLP-dependent enzyme [Eubacteriales bacterium]|nr:aminotransferase class V-fold PLP-dependent enzyme [Eubacteriales bacterium]